MKDVSTKNITLSADDSLIVAAALDAGCKTRYSEDLQHEQQIEGVTITNPLSGDE